MRKNFRTLVFFVLLVFAFTVSLADGPAAVRVGSVEFSAETVQRQMEKSAGLLRQSTGSNIKAMYTEEEFIGEATEYYVLLGVIEMKLKDLGLDTFTAEEKSQLKSLARETYDELWQQAAELVKQDYPDYENIDRLVTETIESSGYTMEDIYESLTRSAQRQKLTDLYCGDITVSDEDTMTWYQEEMIGSYRERYDGNIPLFEEEILMTGESCPYVPDGYFYVKYLTVSADEEHQNGINEAEERLYNAQTALEDAYIAMAEATLEEQGAEEARALYLAAEAEANDAAVRWEQAIEEAENAVTPLADLVMTAMNDGVRFEELIERYSETLTTSDGDPGTPFHPDSVYWDDRLSKAIAALTRYGETTAPVYADGVIYIFCRMDNTFSGVYEPNAEELETMRNTLLVTLQTEKLNRLIDEWRQGYEIVTDASALVCPD